ncbi:MAG: hypothetical protein SW833_25610 [Cyanobacteriota bacterium]|nr:hypothetical protein [Cyanobacteriota bacterium]
MPLIVLLFLLGLAGNWLFSALTVAFPLDVVQWLRWGASWLGTGVFLLFVLWCFDD